MEDLKKINSLHLYTMWKDLSIGMLIYVVLVACTQLLPFYVAPVLALGGACVLYTVIYRHRQLRRDNFIVTLYGLFYSLIVYCIVTITINTLYAWGLVLVPDELIFFNDPYLPSLWLLPCSFFTLLVIYVRKRKLKICRECIIMRGEPLDRTISGMILDREARIQMRNLIIVFGLLSVISWAYYLFSYIPVNRNARDWYVFVWMVLLVFLLDELYFVFRYINLYLDLKDADEVISPDEIQNMTARTYVRFYVVCEDYVYVDPHSIDSLTSNREVLDTPFQSRRAVNGIALDEVKHLIDKATGVDDGELKFFFGRRSTISDRNSILRYFYFLPGTISDYLSLRTPGEWMEFSTLKRIYSEDPGKMSAMFAHDLTRLATIMLTSKTFNEYGVRRTGLRSYNPGFTMKDVRKSTIDFQDDMWIQISTFNSDTPFFRLKTWWRRIKGSHYNYRDRNTTPWR